jgi:hypothetical protein
LVLEEIIIEYALEKPRFDIVMRQLESFTFYTEVEEDEDGELMTFNDSWFDEEQQFYRHKESFVHFIRYYDIHDIKCVDTIVSYKIVCYDILERDEDDIEPVTYDFGNYASEYFDKFRMNRGIGSEPSLAERILNQEIDEDEIYIPE